MSARITRGCCGGVAATMAVHDRRRISCRLVGRLQCRGEPGPLGASSNGSCLRHAQLRRAAGALGASTPPPLDNPDLIMLGAGHFHRACAHCHGAPGMPRDLTAQQCCRRRRTSRIAPNEWKDRELFWIVKHGIKYTGMPAWVAQERDDEVWAVVAFLKRLPDARRAGLPRAGARPGRVPPQSGRDIATVGLTPVASAPARAAMAPNDAAPPSALVPVLHGQPPNSWSRPCRLRQRHARKRHHAAGRGRSAPTMRSRKLARLLRAAGSPAAADAGAPIACDSGRALATRRRSGREDPGLRRLSRRASAATTYPAARRAERRLHGQPAAALEERPDLAIRSDAIMAPIARLLSDEQIEDVSAYFAAAAPTPARARVHEAHDPSRSPRCCSLLPAAATVNRCSTPHGAAGR